MRTEALTFPEYASNPNGGDVLATNLNLYYDKGDLAWILCASLVCWLITPAIGLLYAGMSRRKSASVMLLQSLFCATVVGLQFWIYGFSMIMSRSNSPFIGNLDLAFLKNTLGYASHASVDIPDILLAAFHFTFVTIAATILSGAMLERGRLFPSMLFILCWTTFVYYFLAYWEWNPNGWLLKLGVYDFAGSGPVHIASGFAALAWSLMLGKRKDPCGESLNQKHSVPYFRPHNPSMFTLGTCLIWFGWFGFNGGSTANLSIRSIYVVVNTNLAAMGGATTWGILDYMYMKKLSLIGVCSGVIAGLVGITPAAGYIPVYVAPVVGTITSFVCFFVAKYKYVLRIDDGLDIFALHGCGGLMGDILTGFFASKNVPAMDGVSIGASEYKGGWWNQHYAQIGYQLAAALTCAAWSFTISCVLLLIINKIPRCQIRANEQEEFEGLDDVYLEDGPISGYSVCRTDGASVTYGISADNPTGNLTPHEKTEIQTAVEFQ